MTYIKISVREIEVHTLFQLLAKRHPESRNKSKWRRRYSRWRHFFKKFSSISPDVLKRISITDPILEILQNGGRIQDG
jgi:hypothetical protein